MTEPKKYSFADCAGVIRGDSSFVVGQMPRREIEITTKPKGELYDYLCGWMDASKLTNLPGRLTLKKGNQKITVEGARCQSVRYDGENAVWVLSYMELIQEAVSQ